MTRYHYGDSTYYGCLTEVERLRWENSTGQEAIADDEPEWEEPIDEQTFIEVINKATELENRYTRRKACSIAAEAHISKDSVDKALAIVLEARQKAMQMHQLRQQWVKKNVVPSLIICAVFLGTPYIWPRVLTTLQPAIGYIDNILVGGDRQKIAMLERKLQSLNNNMENLQADVRQKQQELDFLQQEIKILHELRSDDRGITTALEDKISQLTTELKIMQERLENI